MPFNAKLYRPNEPLPPGTLGLPMLDASGNVVGYMSLPDILNDVLTRLELLEQRLERTPQK
jgi:hypothetical protein